MSPLRCIETVLASATRAINCVVELCFAFYLVLGESLIYGIAIASRGGRVSRSRAVSRRSLGSAQTLS